MPRKALRAVSTIRPIEAYTPNANIAADGIRELKREYKSIMNSTNTPEVLWYLCLIFCLLIRSHTVMNIHTLGGNVPAAVLMGDTPVISHICEFP